jgi:putative GTP pyrophosphokinase
MVSADHDSLDDAYTLAGPVYEKLRTEIAFAVRESLDAAEIKYHVISARTKTLESLRAKAVRRNWANPLQEASDIVGARVVVLFKSDVARAVDVLKETFSILKEDDKATAADASSFGYSGTHLDCRLGDGFAGIRYDRIKDHVFEIQVRTIVEDAWAAVSHVLGYKGQASIPQELQRDFYALSGMFYVADQHFEMLYDQAEQVGREASEAVASPVPEPLPFNADTLVALLNNRYPDREPATRSLAAELIGELEAAGIDTVSEFEALLDRADHDALRYEDAYPPGPPGQYYSVGFARVCLYLASERARQSLSEAHGHFLDLIAPYVLDE